MPARNQFVVPQFLDVESKIIGPITARQFVIMLAVLLMEFIIYRLFLNIFVIIGIGIPLLGAGLLFSFAKVNGQPFHFIALNFIQTFRKPVIRIWDKTMSLDEIKALLKKEPEEIVTPTPRKTPLEQSRLAELSLVVNTGGVYTPEDEKRL